MGISPNILASILMNAVATQSSLLLDTLSLSATMAYSTRKLRNSYNGSALRVRRSNDDAELDIGFSGIDLDTITLLNHVGSNNGFVTTWYDQIGSKNAIQTNTLRQPWIVNSGSMILQNNKPSFYYYSNPWDQRLQIDNTGSPFAGTSRFSLNLVTNLYTSGNFDRIISIQYSPDSNDYGYTTSLVGLGQEGNYQQVRTNRNNIKAVHNIPAYNQLFTSTVIYDETTSNIYIDGSSGVSSSFPETPLGSPLDIWIGGCPKEGLPFRGYTSEVILFSSNIGSSDKLKIQENQKAYFNTP